MSNNVELPAEVRLLIDQFARAHRALVPAVLTGIIVTGSATLGDWWPGVSDVDLVMIVERPLSSAELTAVAPLHAPSISATSSVPDSSSGSAPTVDGIYLTEAQLAAGPSATVTAAQVTDGVIDESQSGGQLSWVTWREIEHGVESVVTDAGARDWLPSERTFAGSELAVRRFSQANLRDYWSPLGVGAREQLAALVPDAVVAADTVQWIALGPARLLATIQTGGILSKSAAATFASARWPQYADVLARAVAARAGHEVTFGAADALSALELLERCVEAGAASSIS